MCSCEHPGVRQHDFRTPRVCVSCSDTFAGEQLQGPTAIGWTPLRRGWRCPHCSRAHLARVDELARSLVAGHQRHLWVGTQEHAEWDECVWCDVLRRATELALGGYRKTD